MAEGRKQRNDAAFALVLLLLCVLPIVGFWWWHDRSETPLVCAPVIYELRPGTTLELRAVSFGKSVSDQFWSPNGVPISPADLLQTGGGGDARMRFVYLQCVTRGGSENEFPRLRIRQSPLVSGVGHIGTSSSQPNSETREYRTNYTSGFVPEVGLFKSTELEVSYSSLGSFDVGALEPGETKKEFSVAGVTVVVSLRDEFIHTQAQRRVDVSWKATDIDFDIRMVNSEGESVGPRNSGRSDSRQQKLRFVEFAEENFSQIKIRGFHRDKKIKFSGISYAPGSYTQPKVTAVEP